MNRDSLGPAFNRRELVRAGALGLFGLGLPSVLRADVPKRKAKACIVLFMWGGPAQQDAGQHEGDAPAQLVHVRQ